MSKGERECHRCFGEGKRWNNATEEVTVCGACRGTGRLGEGEILGVKCIDNGACHHDCKDRCFRRECCAPFSDYNGPWEYEDRRTEQAATVPDGQFVKPSVLKQTDVQYSANSTPAPAGADRRDAEYAETLKCCRKWFERHSPTAPLIGGFGDAEHPMLTLINASLAKGEGND